MTLQQLEYVVALADHRHFVRAAESCHITQPTLTMQLKKLEDEIGFQLFDRTKKPIELTPTGELVVMKAREILRETILLKDLVIQERDSLKGEFRIGVIPTVAPYLVPRFLNTFVKQNPNTQLIIQELQTHEIVQALKSDQLDIGIAATPLEERNIRELALYYEPFLLYGFEGHHSLTKEEVEVDNLATNDLLLLSQGHCFREQALAVCNDAQQGKEKRGFHYESGSIEALTALVDQQMGITLVPELAITKQIKKVNIRRFKAPEPSREISLVVLNSFAKEQLLTALHESILAVVPSTLKTKKLPIRVSWR